MWYELRIISLIIIMLILIISLRSNLHKEFTFPHIRGASLYVEH